jgi:hypothetical protein
MTGGTKAWLSRSMPLLQISPCAPLTPHGTIIVGKTKMVQDRMF